MTEGTAHPYAKIGNCRSRLFQDIFLYICWAFIFSVKKQPGLSMSFNLKEYYSNLSKGDVLLAYKGSITSDLINDILEAVEKKLEEANAESKLRKKIYNVLVESLQNLFHHIETNHEGIQEELDPKFGVLVIEREGEFYKVTTGNFVNTRRIKFLKEKIDKINSLTKDELEGHV